MAYEISKRLHCSKARLTLRLPRCRRCARRAGGVGYHIPCRHTVSPGFLDYFDRAQNAFVSAYRKYREKENFDVFIEYIASPRLDGKTLILVDPLRFATGSSMELAIAPCSPKRTTANNTCGLGYTLRRTPLTTFVPLSRREHHRMGRSHRPRNQFSFLHSPLVSATPATPPTE